MVIARVELIHIQEQYLNDEGFLDTQKLDLVARMGDSWYCHANGDALFQIAKPLRTKGMGVDQLPKSITNSNIFTGNDLGRLGNIEALPEQDDIEKLRVQTNIASILDQNISLDEKQQQLHKIAKELLHDGKKIEALAMALLGDQL